MDIKERAAAKMEGVSTIYYPDQVVPLLIEFAEEVKAIDIEKGLDKDELKESIKQFYKEEKIMQKTIERDTLNEIYDLYSKLIDDLYDGYLESGWNMGIVDINGEERNMGEMLDLLNNKFRKAMEE